MLKDYLPLLICPECKGAIAEIDIDNKLIGLYCNHCKLVFPVIEDVPILLNNDLRNYDLEHDKVNEIKMIASEKGLSDIIGYANHTIDLFNKNMGKKRWAWEDEIFWSKEYKNNLNFEEIEMSERMWLRSFLTDRLIKDTDMGGKTILDVGCGDGQSFRSLLSGHCMPSTVYIACDISFNGIILNRRRNKHKNSLYVLCSADHIPLIDKSVDVICYFGVLHHLEKKENTAALNLKLLKENGYVILDEALDRKEMKLFARLFGSNLEKSEHEEYINGKNLLKIIRNHGMRVVVKRECNTPFFTLMFMTLQDPILKNRKLFNFIASIDIMIIKSIGKITNHFGPGEMLLLAKNFGDR